MMSEFIERWQMSDEVAWRISSMANGYIENCGLVYGHLVVYIGNISVEPRLTFEMDPTQQLEVMERRGLPDAIWHTHPGGYFGLSPVDLIRLPRDLPLIVGVPDGRVGVWLDGHLVQEWSHGQEEGNQDQPGKRWQAQTHR